MKFLKKRKPICQHYHLLSFLPLHLPLIPISVQRFRPKGSAEVSTIIKIIPTVSKRGIDGLAEKYRPRVQIYKLSHRHMFLVMNSDH